MKTLLLVRHAKSDWNDPSLPDIERPLNDRGKKDAPAMAEKLLHKKIKIDAFISSPARRARKTCTKFMKVYGRDKDEIRIEQELYEAEVNNFLSVIKKLPANLGTVAIFSHNPGITYFANSLTDARIDNMPTCSVFAVGLHEDDWATIEPGKKEFLFFDTPRPGAD